MVLDPDLHNLCFYVLGGDSESVSVLEPYDVSEYEWLLYLIPGSYSDIGSHGRGPNTDLFEYLTNAYNCSFDLLGMGTSSKKILSLLGTTIQFTNSVNRCASSIAETAQEEGGYYVLNSNHIELLSPFLGVGTKIPTTLTASNLADAVKVLSSPCNTHGLLVGNGDLAREVMGAGLQGFRQVVVSHIGIQPGELSAPLDIGVPLVYSEYCTNPTVLEVANTAEFLQDGSKSKHMLISVVAMACCMYSILENDHEYLGLEVLNQPGLPNGRLWSIQSSSAVTQVPFRYPALVALLNSASRYSGPTEGSDELEVDSALDQWGSDSILSQLGALIATQSQRNKLFEDMPKLAKSFFVQLYRLTCKGVIELPSKSVFPRRTEASKTFVSIYNGYTKRSTLAGYMELADLLLQSSLLQQRAYLRPLSILYQVRPFDIVSAPDTLGPLPLVGSTEDTQSDRLWPWKRRQDKMSQWGSLQVKLPDGRVVTVESLIQEREHRVLTKFDELLLSDDRYSLFDSRSIKDLGTEFGYSNSRINEGLKEPKLVSGIKFNTGPFRGRGLSDVIEYHQNLRHPSTEKTLKLLVKLLAVNDMDELVNSDPWHSRDKAYRFAQAAARLALKQHIQQVLDRSGV